MFNACLRYKIIFMSSLALLAMAASCDDNKSTDIPATVPARPENLSAAPLSPTSALLQWDDMSNNEEQFEVFRAEKGPFAHIGSTIADESTFLDSLLDDSSSYRYYVTASNAAGSSAPSETVSVTTPASGFPPGAPRNPSPADDSIGVPIDVTLVWQCSEPDNDPLTFDIYLGYGPYLNLADSNLTVPSYVPDSLGFGITYNWKVVAWDDDRHHTDGPVWHFTTVDSTANDTTFMIRIDLSGQGYVTVDPDRPRFSMGDTVILTAVPDTGWYFVGWGGDTSGVENPLTIIMTRDFHIVANFEAVADSATTGISGTVIWPGHQLSPHTYAFIDSFYDGSPHLFAQTDVDPSDGTFLFTIPNQSDTLYVEFQAHDDVNGNGPWNPIDPADGWGFYDANGDSIRNDYFLIPPGTHIDSVRITLRSANE